MENWKRMYAILCGAISDALDILPLIPENMPAVELLHDALEEAEELYISVDDS